ncbi:MAG: hypothetical protein JWM11_3168 [Planctomycetaceae bacterium]|nr:hypothetical protein [Planctomycetaceae bacterium]
MTERDQIYLKILHFGLVQIRAVARGGNARYCTIEAEHLHNIPTLIGESNEHRHTYYLDIERTWYLEHVDQTVEDIDFTLRRYTELWRQLEKLRIPT